jgi:hypothetical protein
MTALRKAGQHSERDSKIWNDCRRQKSNIQAQERRYYGNTMDRLVRNMTLFLFYYLFTVTMRKL